MTQQMKRVACKKMKALQKKTIFLRGANLFLTKAGTSMILSESQCRKASNYKKFLLLLCWRHVTRMAFSCCERQWIMYHTTDVFSLSQALSKYKLHLILSRFQQLSGSKEYTQNYKFAYIYEEKQIKKLFKIKIKKRKKLSTLNTSNKIEIDLVEWYDQINVDKPVVFGKTVRSKRHKSL